MFDKRHPSQQDPLPVVEQKELVTASSVASRFDRTLSHVLCDCWIAGPNIKPSRNVKVSGPMCKMLVEGKVPIEADSVIYSPTASQLTTMTEALALVELEKNATPKPEELKAKNGRY